MVSVERWRDFRPTGPFTREILQTSAIRPSVLSSHCTSTFQVWLPDHAPFNMSDTVYCKAISCVILPTCCSQQRWTWLRHLQAAERVWLTSPISYSYQLLCNPIYAVIPNTTRAQRPSLHRCAIYHTVSIQCCVQYQFFHGGLYAGYHLLYNPLYTL
jgi:hypothetical protein